MNLFAGVDGVLEPVADLLAGLAEHVRDVLRREGVRVDVDVPAGFALLRTTRLVDDAQVERIHREAGQPVADLEVGLKKYRLVITLKTDVLFCNFILQEFF